MKINVAIAGGPCTGKSTLAAALFAQLKIKGFDYDLVTEECRKLKREFKGFRTPFDRLYMWRQQEREELRSLAKDGFITDIPLFHYYVQAKQFAREERDKLAFRELLRWWTEKEDRYHLIVVAQNPLEFPFKNDASRRGSKKQATERHNLIRSFVEHFLPDQLLFVQGTLEQRLEQVIKKLTTMRARRPKRKNRRS